MSIKTRLMHVVLKHGRRKSRKKKPWLGERFMVPRTGRKPVEVILYRPEKPAALPVPVLFNVHGGSWVGGDASQMDTQSKTWAEMLGAFVVNINYTKADDKPFPYMQNEVFDTVLYFAEHASEYGIDKTRFSLIGYSAGGNVCAGVSIMLRDAGFSLNTQVLCYPFLDFHMFDHGGVAGFLDEKTVRLAMDIYFPGRINRYDPIYSPAAAPDETLRGLAPCEIVACGLDPLNVQAMAYEKRLTEAGVPVALKEYPNAKHGFLEFNWPESENAPDPEQKKYRDDAMRYITERLRLHWK